MRGAQTLRETVPGWSPPARRGNYTLGVFRGEGIGPEVTEATIAVLHAAIKDTDVSFTIRHGGVIGTEALKERGTVLTGETGDFCRAMFAEQAAVLCGPGGGRFVYELRSALDLYCK